VSDRILACFERGDNRFLAFIRRLLCAAKADEPAWFATEAKGFRDSCAVFPVVPPVPAGQQFQPFIPLRLIPPTRCFWAARNNKIKGKEPMTLAAKIRGQSARVSDRNRLRPTVRG